MYLQPFRLPYISAYFMLTVVGGSLVLTPPRLVVEYGSPALAVCSTNLTIETMAWEASQGAVDVTHGVQQLTWNVSRLMQWDIKPLCFINLDKQGNQDRKYLPVTVYKNPDIVSITLVNHIGPVIEGGSYQLKCDIQNVAPVHNVIVNWYKEQTIVKTDNETSKETAKEPQNKTVSLLIRPNRADDRAQYSCEAVLDLGAEGPLPPHRTSSGPVRIPVHYMPLFPNQVETVVDRGAGITLNCTVKANPPASYSWTSEHLNIVQNTSVLHSSVLGNYTCTASNKYGSDRKVFTVTKKPSRVVFWSILGTGLGLALALVAGYGVYVLFIKEKSSNSVI